MFRIIAVAMFIPTMFAAWAGSQIAAAQKATPERVVLAGCVARQTASGITNTASADPANKDLLVLTRVLLPQGTEGRGAVPGTTASGGNTGTIGTTPSGTSGKAEQTYELAGSPASELRSQVGKRVEVTGTLVPSATPAADVAHTSSPRGVVTVASHRPIGGACPIG